MDNAITTDKISTQPNPNPSRREANAGPSGPSTPSAAPAETAHPSPAQDMARAQRAYAASGPQPAAVGLADAAEAKSVVAWLREHFAAHAARSAAAQVGLDAIDAETLLFAQPR